MDDLKEETVDFAYAIDCTGSMSSYIKSVENDIKSVVDQMKKEFPLFKLRLGAVAYRDWCDGSDRLETKPFTENVDSFKSWIGSLKAKGGGDTPEDVLGGLSCAADLQWISKLRVLFHICDAPPHNKMYHSTADDHPDGHPSDPSNYHQVVLDKLKNKNIHLCIAKLNDSVSKMITVFQDYGKKIELTIEERNVSNASLLLNAVQKTLKLLSEARKEIKLTQHKCEQITSKMNDLKCESEEFYEETTIQINNIGNDIKNTKDDIQKVDEQVTNTKRELDELKNNYSVLIQYARSDDVKTENEIEKAENDVMALNIKMTQINQSFSESQTKLNNTLKTLMDKSHALTDTDTKATKISDKAKNIRNETMNLKASMDKMKNTADRNSLKKDIKNKLKTIQDLFKSDAETKSKIMSIRRDILKAFNEAKSRSKEITECQRDVLSKLDELDNILDELDDKRA